MGMQDERKGVRRVMMGKVMKGLTKNRFFFFDAKRGIRDWP